MVHNGSIITHSKMHQSGQVDRCKLTLAQNPILTFASKVLAPVQCIEIYVLIDPIRSVPFYIGQSRDAERRFNEHTLRKPVVPEAKDAYIARLLALGTGPRLEIIERCTEADAHWRERHWINWFSLAGCPLTNGEALHWRRKHLSEVGMLYLPTRFDVLAKQKAKKRKVRIA